MRNTTTSISLSLLLSSAVRRRVNRRELCQKRSFCSSSTQRSSAEAHRLLYSEFGNPLRVVRKESFLLPDRLPDDEVIVRMVAAPINPSDINTIQGVYAVKPELPSIPGNEGFGIIERIGSSVSDFSIGDWVIPFKNALGTWQTHARWKAKDIKKIAKDIGVVHAATIAVNPCSAYRMLHDFVPLAKGDTVIQNGANSAVGQAVIQICKQLGVITVNVVRNRENIDELKQRLKALGTNYVLTEEEYRSGDVFNKVRPPKLSLDCVAGKSGAALMYYLTPKGTHVVYGGMSKQPLSLPVGFLIFKDIQVVGYWLTRWKWDHSDGDEWHKMLDFLCEMVRSGQLAEPSHEFVALDDYMDVLRRSQEGFNDRKFIFKFSEP